MRKAQHIVDVLLDNCGHCPEDEPDVQRYLDMVKAQPHLKRLTKEQLRRYLATRPPAQPEPPGEPHQIVPENLCVCGKCGKPFNWSALPEAQMGLVRCPVCNAKVDQEGSFFGESVEQDLISVSKKIKHCGDYGVLYYHPGKHEVHWTAGDSDGPPEYTHPDEIVKLLKLPGIKHVEIGDEWSPDEDEGWKRLNEAEEPLDPQDIRSEVDRLLPTKTYRLAGNSMIHAPGVIRMAQNEWQVGRKKQKQWAMGVIKAWQGLPEEVYLKILNGDCEIETQGDNAVVTVKQY